MTPASAPGSTIRRPGRSPQQFLRMMMPEITGGVLSGLMVVVSSVSCAVLVFSGTLDPSLPLGFTTALTGALVQAAVVALRSSFRFAIACPDPATAVILAIVTANIAKQLEPLGAPATIATVWAAIVLSTLAVGLSLLALGHFQLGRLIRFLPYPVIGGFMAGTGWLLADGAIHVMAGSSLEADRLVALFLPGAPGRWLPGVLYGLALLILGSRFRRFWVLPALLVAGIAASHGMRLLSGMSLSQASAEGWFLEPIRSSSLAFWPTDVLSQVQWGTLLGQSPNLAPLIGVVAINVLLDATGTEIAVGRDADLDRELRANGDANLLACLAGGMFGYFSMCFSLLNNKAGGTRRVSGLIAALLCAFALWKGGDLLILLPRAVLGGLLFSIGLELFLHWAVRSWQRLSRLDYALVITILVVVVSVNFLAGIGVGLLIACIIFVFNYSRISVVKYILSGNELTSSFSRSWRERQLLNKHVDEILVLCLQSYIFFGTAHSLYETVLNRLREARAAAPVRYLVLDFRLVSRLDSSAALSFTKIERLAESKFIALIYCGLSDPLRHILSEGGCLTGPDECRHVGIDIDHSIEWCEERILCSEGFSSHQSQQLGDQLLELLPSGQQIEEFMSYFKPIDVPADHYLFHQHDPPRDLYFIESGQVTIWLELPDDQRTRLRTMGAGTVIGEMGLFTGERRSASVVTDRPSLLHALSAEALAEMRRRSPQLADVFQTFVIRTLSERLRHCETQLQALLL